jgi:sugar fermentation stimulation protein A
MLAFLFFKVTTRRHMEFTGPLVKGRLQKRYKRFLADVMLEDGQIVTAHCPNTGAMTHCIEPDMQVLLRYDPNPKRKLAYTWEIAITQQGHWIGINTHNANKLVEETLLNSSLIMDVQNQTVRKEYKLASGNSRLDFAIIDEYQKPLHFIEVKSATLLENGHGYFPDAVTDRGTKHCLELARLAEEGYPSTLVFCAQHSGIKTVSPARHIDSKYADALGYAADKGVTILACGCDFSDEKIVINQRLPVIM